MSAPVRPSALSALARMRHTSEDPYADLPDETADAYADLPDEAPSRADLRRKAFEHLEAEANPTPMSGRDVAGMAASFTQGASFDLADDLPLVGGAIGRAADDFQQRHPGVATMNRVLGGIVVPGAGSLKAIKAVAPTRFLGQVVMGTGVGAVNAGVQGFGAAEGSIPERLEAGLEAAKTGAKFGAAAGVAVPVLAKGAIKGQQLLGAIKRKPREAMALARSATKLATGQRPALEDVLTLGKAVGRPSAPGRAFAGLGQDVDVRELGPRSTRLNPERALEGTYDKALEQVILGSDAPPIRLGAPPPTPPSGPPRLTLMPNTSTGPRPSRGVSTSRPGPSGPTASLESAAAPALDPMDDPLLRAMAEQAKRGKPTPKPGQAVGPKPSKADRIAEMKARSLDGEVVRESELKGLTLAERIEARGGQQALEAAKATGDRAEYSAYLKKHGQTSEVRRGEVNDLTRDPAKMAEKAALQAEADALPDTPEGNKLRDVLYRQWKKLQDEHGRIGPAYGRTEQTADGFDVGTTVKNRSSIDAELSGTDYRELPGIRRVPMSDFDVTSPNDLFYAADDIAKAKQLADAIRKSNRIDPLIVVVDQKGPYVLEGGHRLGAMSELGASEVPAIVVLEEGVSDEAGKAALKMMAGTGAAAGGALTAALAADAVKRKQGRGAP